MRVYYFRLFLVLFLINYNCKTFAQDTTEKQEIATNDDVAISKYKMLCAVCHGSDGKLNINGASDLSKSKFTKKERIKIITNGKGLMMPFKGILKKDEIKAIAKYLEELIEE